MRKCGALGWRVLECAVVRKRRASAGRSRGYRDREWARALACLTRRRARRVEAMRVRRAPLRRTILLRQAGFLRMRGRCGRDLTWGVRRVSRVRQGPRASRSIQPAPSDRQGEGVQRGREVRFVTGKESKCVEEYGERQPCSSNRSCGETGARRGSERGVPRFYVHGWDSARLRGEARPVRRWL